MEERRAKDAAWNLCQIINTCGNLKTGQSMKMAKLYRPANQDPKNPYYKVIIGK